MNDFKILTIGGIILIMLACQTFAPKAKTFEHPAFSFTIPAGWQTMEELGGYPQEEGKDYYALGLEEIIMITSAQAKADGLYSAYFAVASSLLAGGTDLETRFQQTYNPLIPDLRKVSQTTFDSGTSSGLEITYQRPWGEPWWQFRDIWLEKDSVIYVLSFHGSPNDFEKYRADFDLILESFKFK